MDAVVAYAITKEQESAEQRKKTEVDLNLNKEISGLKDQLTKRNLAHILRSSSSFSSSSSSPLLGLVALGKAIFWDAPSTPVSLGG
jgi:hypothetical protein